MQTMNRIAAVLVALVGGAFPALGVAGDGPKPVVMVPSEITYVTTCAFDIADGLDDVQQAWSGIHDGRHFAAGVVDGLPGSDVRAATRLARRYARTRGGAERVARASHARLARALNRWSGRWDAGFYAPAAIAGLTRSIWRAEQAADAADETVAYFVARGAPAASFAAFVDAAQAARRDAQLGVAACDALNGMLQDRAGAAYAELTRDSYRRILESRLEAADRMRAAAAAADGRARATQLTRVYRLLIATVRRGERFLALEHRALRRLVAASPDGSITNDTGRPLMVYEIRAAFTVMVMRRRQTTHALASDGSPGALPLMLDAGSSLDAFDWLVFDRDTLAAGVPGIVRITYETNIGNVPAAYRIR